MKAALLIAIGAALAGCGGDMVPPWMEVGVVIQPGGNLSPNIFSAPAGGAVTFADNDSVSYDIDFGSPVDSSRTVQPGGRVSFRMPSDDPGYPISFHVSDSHGSGSSGSVSIYLPPAGRAVR